MALDNMEGEGRTSTSTPPYRDTGTWPAAWRRRDQRCARRARDDDPGYAVQQLQGTFEERIEAWNNKLYMVSEVLEAWLNVQRNWLYLQPIFESRHQQAATCRGQEVAAVIGRGGKR